MAQHSNRRTTLADLQAASAMGAMDPSTPVITLAEAERMAAEAAVNASVTSAAERAADVVAALPLPPDTHACGIVGCSHGTAAHPAHPGQPDRQVKLQSPCGAVARMTAAALARAGGTITCSHGDPFAVAARRAYTPRGTTGRLATSADLDNS